MKMNAESLLLNGKCYSYSEIKEGRFELETLTTFEKSTLEFCQQWLSGQQEFTIHTSGSTGEPKVISITRKQMQVSARMTVQALALQAGDSALTCINTAYIGGRMMLVRSMEHQLYLEAVEPASNPLLHFPENKRIDFTAMVPLQLQQILSNEKTREILNNMRAIIVGGAPVSEQLEEQLQLIKAPIYSTYGMTETVSHIALRQLNGSKASPYFHALEEVQLKTDSRGCLIIKSAVTNGQELTTNDVVELLDEKRFRWIGRADNIINSGGIKIQLEEIERTVEMIFRQLHIKNRFFVWGMPDASLGQKLILVIEGEQVPQPEELLQRLDRELDKYRKPKEIRYVSIFSETPTGKIQKTETIKLL